MSGSWGFPAPILPGKEADARGMGDHLRAHRTEWDESHRRAGITLERTYLMTTPQGGLFVEYGETDTGFGESLGAMLTLGPSWMDGSSRSFRRSRVWTSRSLPRGRHQN